MPNTIYASEAHLAYSSSSQGLATELRAIRATHSAAFDEVQIERDAIAMAERLIDSEFPDDGVVETDDAEEAGEEYSLPTPEDVALRLIA